MDPIINQQLEELIVELQKTGDGLTDPVTRVMVTTLLYQAQKIKDEISRIPERVVERLCSTFVPKNKIGAVPAVCLVQLALKNREDMPPHVIADGTSFSYKVNTKQNLTYYPIFKTLLLPFSNLYLLAPGGLRTPSGYSRIQNGKRGQVWLGLETASDVETFHNVTFLIKGTGGILPKRISVDHGERDLSFAPASQLDEVPMPEPFDSQQMGPEFIELVSMWRHKIDSEVSGRLVTMTDILADRDAFKPKTYPKLFENVLESDDLARLDDNILWVLFDFGADFEVPDEIEILPNVVPVVNVSVNSVSLTQTSPIAKLTKNDGSFFLSVIETPLATQRQGFNANIDEFVVRDFDIAGYNPDTLYKDVRNLYNHFIDDYYAFVEYHSLKDGETIRSLREMVNRLAKNVKLNPDNKTCYDEGTYVMRNVSLSAQAAAVRVSYLTTFGRLGNAPKAGDLMENKKDAALEKYVSVITSADCGEDKASVDQMYEMLRYYTLTADRLYTKMDIDAFLRYQLLKEFGNEETSRISYEITVQGAGGEVKLRRGLYVFIRFKDKKNYQKAVSLSFDEKMRQLIIDKSCISMPVIVKLINSESS